ncbi:MAG: O-antigen ligase family protein [Vulcanimicrobiaceae bacterium]
MKRALPSAFALVHGALPLFPSFVMLAGVSVPGVSVIPPNAAAVVLAAMVLAAIYAGVLLLQAPREAPPTLIPLLAWLGSAVLAALLGLDPLAGTLFVGVFGLGIVWHLSILRFYRRPHVASAIWWSYLATGTLGSLVAIAMVLTHRPAAQYTIGHGRAIGTFVLPGELAGYLIVFLPLAYAVATTTRRPALRYVAWCGIGSGLLALVLSFSRTGWVGFASVVAFYGLVTGRMRWRSAVAVVAVSVLAVLAVFNFHHNPSENYTRLSIWRAAFSAIARFPLTGVGPLDFSRIYAHVRIPDGDAVAFHAHNAILTIFAETGIIGVAAVVWTWWRFAQTLLQRLRAARPIHVQLALAAAAGLFGTLVQGLIDTVSVVIFGLWLPTMALALVLARDGLGEDLE